jgi:hypothetical protein
MCCSSIEGGQIIISISSSIMAIVLGWLFQPADKWLARWFHCYVLLTSASVNVKAPDTGAGL